MQALVTFALVVSIAAILAVPAVVAIVRKHPSWVAITFLTAALGWTGLGWLAALWWALRPTERRRHRARRVKSRRSRSPSTPAIAPAPSYSGANDNASVPVRATIVDVLPDVVVSAAYEDWLERGGALRDVEPGADGPASATGGVLAA